MKNYFSRMNNYRSYISCGGDDYVQTIKTISDDNVTNYPVGSTTEVPHLSKYLFSPFFRLVILFY